MPFSLFKQQATRTRSGPLPLRARGIVVGVVDPPDAVADAGARRRGGAADLGIASGPAYPGDQHQFRDTPYLQGNTRANEQVSSPRDRMQKSITVTDPRRVELELERDMILRGSGWPGGSYPHWSLRS